MIVQVRSLRPGEAVPLTELGVTADDELSFGLNTAGDVPDLVALLVDGAGRVRSDDDLVFYNNAASLDGAVRHLGNHQGADWLRLRPAGLDADVARVVLGCAGGQPDATHGAVELTFTVTGGGQQVATATLLAEPAHHAMVLVEVYRRADAWRLRLLAQGNAGGLEDLVTRFGVQVEDPAGTPAPEPIPGSMPEPPVAGPPPTPPVAPVQPHPAPAGAAAPRPAGAAAGPPARFSR